MSAVPLDPATVSQAAAWMARLWSDQASAADQAACGAWRAAHPDHERAWRRLQAVEDKLVSVPREIAQHALREPAASAWVTRRRALHLLGLGVSAGAAWSLAAPQPGTASRPIAALPPAPRARSFCPTVARWCWPAPRRSTCASAAPSAL
ncbi:DUF4880 domain-containing protein [Massilia genomosp. 1]|uniref:DUF4880 domain-containing protein n=1 Tax=Massilia genomosp. 1 TaxID=2609280 RepID=UPI001E3BA8CF|nr:DUF4880 domain-containing protein [Massilia genomosp. 1]